MVTSAQPWRWRGSSGDLYDYQVLALGTPVREVLGTYIFARRNATGCWDAVYVGQGRLTTDLNSHFLGREIRARAATHVHFHENAFETARRIEVADIMDGNPEAYTPEGCNPPPVREPSMQAGAVDLATMAMWRLR